jgi:beta-mannanase
VRLGIEANGNWEADYVGNTAQEATDWAETYDSEVAAMRAVPGTNFEFVWNPNACYSSGVSSLAGWYPGNAYVDIVGADLYDDTSFQAYFDDGDDGVTQLGSTVPQSVAAYQAAFSGNTGPA